VRKLEPVRPIKVADVVAGTLRTRIVTGELQHDDPIPPEIELMSEMHVARTTVREALRILESEDLVIIRRGAGGGARVRVPSGSTVARYVGLLLQYEGATISDVHRARTMLEAPAARMLAEATTPEMVAALREALEREAVALDDPQRASRAHGEFHQCLVALTGSQTYGALTAVTNRIIQAQADVFFTAHAGADDTRRGLRAAHRAHSRLVDLVADGAADQAEQMWRRHLEAIEAVFAKVPGTETVLDLLY
jgi:DNA-binding FadR family transcriptional regulator